MVTKLWNRARNDTRLQSIADSMFQGVEEVDARVESIKSRLDEVAVVLPFVIAAVAGIVILGVLIGVYSNLMV